MAGCSELEGQFARKADTARNDYGQDEVNHLRRRNGGRTPRLKPLPRARTAQTPGRTVMVAQHWKAHSCTWHHASSGRHVSSGTLRSTTLHISFLRLRTCDWTRNLNNCRQRAQGNPRRESQSHGPNLAAAQPANHRLRRQHSTAHSCTVHHANCNSRFTSSTLSFRNRYIRERTRCGFARLEKQQLSRLLSSQPS